MKLAAACILTTLALAALLLAFHLHRGDPLSRPADLIPSADPATLPAALPPAPTLAPTLAEACQLHGAVLRRLPLQPKPIDYPPGVDAALFFWDRGAPRTQLSVQGAPGIALHMVTRFVLDAPLPQLEGDEHLKFLCIEGDLVFDPAAPYEQKRAALEKLLWETNHVRIIITDLPPTDSLPRRLKLTELPGEQLP